MLQLGLLRVITWPGSRFKKQRIKAQILFVPTRSSWCSSNLHSADCALDLVWVFVLIFWRWFGYWQFILNRQPFLFLSRVCVTSFFLILLSLYFAWTISSFGITVSGMPQFFVSLLYRFWLFGFFIYEFFDNDCLSLRLFGTIIVFLCFVKTSLVPFVMHLDQLRDYPAPGYD